MIHYYELVSGFHNVAGVLLSLSLVVSSLYCGCVDDRGCESRSASRVTGRDGIRCGISDNIGRGGGAKRKKGNSSELHFEFYKRR
jgi:hypothetical protein